MDMWAPEQQKRGNGLMIHIYTFTTCGQPGPCASHIQGTDGTRMDWGKKARRRSPGFYVDLAKHCWEFHSLMGTIFANSLAVTSFSRITHPAALHQISRNGLKNKFKGSIWPPNSLTFQSIRNLWNVQGKQVWSKKASPCTMQDLKDLLLMSCFLIPKKNFRYLVESIPWQIRAVLENIQTVKNLCSNINTSRATTTENIQCYKRSLIKYYWVN